MTSSTCIFYPASGLPFDPKGYNCLMTESTSTDAVVRNAALTDTIVLSSALVIALLSAILVAKLWK